MEYTLGNTWDEMAYAWSDWKPPLRPSAEDEVITRGLLAKWHAGNPIEKARVFMCGITPEIATMDWPFPVEITAMDQSEGMLRVVWPGDVPGVRHATVGNWLHAGIPDGSRDIVIGDGGFSFFSYPAGQRGLMTAVRKMLKPRGLFVYRAFAQVPKRERLADVLADARAGRIPNFFVFRWRLAMALQPDSTLGVKQDDIWQTWSELAADLSKSFNPPWSERAMATMRFSKGRDTRLYFPTLADFRQLLAEAFEQIEVVVPTYELGERCPMIVARPKKQKK